MSKARNELTLMLICIGSVVFLTCNLISRLALELGMGMTLTYHLSTITLVNRFFGLYLRSFVKLETCCFLHRRMRSSIEIEIDIGT